jgi:outer membrane protein OmpA-like peptidoglycan-associated protein
MRRTHRPCTLPPERTMTRPTSGLQWGRRALASAAILALATTAPAPAFSQSQAPMAEASVEALLDILDAGATSRSFTRTQLPDESTSECKGTAGGTKAAGGTNSTGMRNLEAVPYAGDTTAGVNLDIVFGHGSDTMSAREAALLDNLAKALLNPRLVDARFAVAGHTDATGKPEINLELSCARALAVRKHLARKGVAPRRMTAYGFGSNKPLDGTQATAPRNRRVEIRMAP